LAPQATTPATAAGRTFFRDAQVAAPTTATTETSLLGGLRTSSAQGLSRAARNDTRKITVDLGETTVYDALRELFRMAGVSYRIDENVKEIASGISVTMAAVDVPFKTALNMVVAATRNSRTPLSYMNEGGFYIITADRAGRRPADPVREGKPVTGTAKPTRAASRIPILSDLPIVGRMFVKESERKADPFVKDAERKVDPFVAPIPGLEKKPGAPTDPFR